MMPSFHDVILAWAMGVGVFIALYGIAMAFRYFFGQFIIKAWRWVARNFDTPALCISVLLLITFFFMSDCKTVYSFIMEETLLVGALLGFPILIKRVETNQETLKEAQKQTRTSQYRDARDLLFSEILNSRMKGIDDLWRFARTHPQDEYGNVMDVLTQFIKNPIPYKWEEGTEEEDKKAVKRIDIKEILLYMRKERIEGAEPYPIDLRDAHLEGANLHHAHLEGANLRGAHLEGADLSYAHLEGADLSYAHLEKANLVYAHLEGANLRGVHLEEADLRDAHLEGADLWRVHLERADLRGAHLERSRLRNAHLEGADLEESHLEGADLSDAHLERSNLGGAHLRGAYLFYAHLEGAYLFYADLEGANLKSAIINEADFTDAEDDFKDVMDLTQEKIDKCVFITDHPRYEQPPKLPDGIRHEYRELSMSEWEYENEMVFHDFDS